VLNLTFSTFGAVIFFRHFQTCQNVFFFAPNATTPLFWFPYAPRIYEFKADKLKFDQHQNKSPEALGFGVCRSG